MSRKRKTLIEASDIIMGIGLLAEDEFVRHDLTSRQCQIAHRLFMGESGAYISKTMFITLSGVRYHIGEIYKKTNSRNREEFLRMTWSKIKNSGASWNSKAEMRKCMKEHCYRLMS